jgi:hypothetical protein
MLRCIEAGAKNGYMPEVHVQQLIHKGERLSVGKNKIKGELVRHEAVKRYYPLLNSKERRFVEFRHNARFALNANRQM